MPSYTNDTKPSSSFTNDTEPSTSYNADTKPSVIGITDFIFSSADVFVFSAVNNFIFNTGGSIYTNDTEPS